MVVFIFYFISFVYSDFNLVKGGSFVEDLPLDSLSLVFMPLADPPKQEGELLVIVSCEEVSLDVEFIIEFI